MAKLTLWFTDEADLTLEKTFYCAAPGRERWAVRGSTAGAHRGFETFNWTHAVQSIAILALRTAALGEAAAGPAASLEGHGGSPASSLDFAISKGPAWLLDVFGTDAAGNSMAKRLFRRTNPERKRTGPVTISFNENILRSSDITIMMCGRVAQDAELFLNAADEIERRFYAKKAARASSGLRLDGTGTELKMLPHEKCLRSQSQADLLRALRCPCCGQQFDLSSQVEEAA